jgi:hypothetical protein
MKLALSAVLLFLLSPQPGYGACSGATTGKSKTVGVEISDANCLYKKEHIIFWRLIDGQGVEGAAPHFPFDEECKETKAGFTCRADGHTPLAGTSYKRGTQGKDVCDKTGKTKQAIYRCVKGCRRADVPRILEIGAYEC